MEIFTVKSLVNRLVNGLTSMDFPLEPDQLSRVENGFAKQHTNPAIRYLQRDQMHNTQPCFVFVFFVFFFPEFGVFCFLVLHIEKFPLVCISPEAHLTGTRLQMCLNP